MWYCMAFLNTRVIKILKNTTNLTLCLRFFNVRCIAHASNLISKDICSTSFANQILTKCNTIVTYFKKSHQGGSSLKDEAKACDISGGGLKKWVDTRCMIVQMRHKIPLENIFI
ncbi:hypothetical protein GLOIN_2v1762219 [Rhizophagus irregularis DAOM 181602=DAOM 197198]|nr:hypothetical protein GLOIN_2v1762219 [Rhizophagus irregularis DAOM 181602=DAOM 197198]